MYSREICKSEALQKTTQIKIKQVVMRVHGADASTCKSRLLAKLVEAVHLDVCCDELLGCGCGSIYADL